ncbi:MAG: PhzF family phenazine biosynthesis protein [Candidatus Eremiobacteraeota bacterium]|nr:PhzF family phenazine biosynthesis protein [Candidatus Eremiobacteraeota bacterium]
MDLHYRVVDVFTKIALEGNPLAVFPDARGLDDALMQRIARELNLSETSFVFPTQRGDCIADVRIFTPSMEMPFAGHPTVGTAFVLWQDGYPGTESRAFNFEERVGPIPVHIDDGDDPLVWLTTPSISSGRTVTQEAAARAIGLSEGDLIADVPSQLLTAGNPNIYIAVRDKAAVDRAWVDTSTVRNVNDEDEATCIFVFTPTPEGAYSRMFAPEVGVIEDPATGSATGPLALFMMTHGLAPSNDGATFISEQGTKMGRRSFLHVRIRGENGRDGIDVGGNVRALVRATMTV